MITDHRQLRDIDHVVVANIAGTSRVRVRIQGKNSKGNYAAVTLELDWWVWPIIADEMAAAWKTERAKRIEEVTTIDSTFGERKAS